MILSGLEIKKRLGSTVFIEPFDEGLLNPNSYNLRLHDRLLVYRERELDMKKTNEVREVAVPAEEMVLEPGTLYLGRSLEYTRTEGLVPMLGGGGRRWAGWASTSTSRSALATWALPATGRWRCTASSRSGSTPECRSARYTITL